MAPTIWSAVVVDADGLPAAGADVDLYVRPMDTGRVNLIPLSSGVTDSDGNVTLRGVPSAAAQAAFVAGRADLVMMAQKDNLVAIPQYLTEEFDPVADSGAGVWLTPQLRRAAHVAPKAAHLRLGRIGASPKAAKNHLGLGAVPAVSAPTCHTSLTKWNTVNIANTKAYVGQTEIAALATGWKSSITYENTKNSTFQTGFSWTVGGGPLSFEVNGEVSHDSGVSVSATGTYAGKSTATNRKQAIVISHFYDEYRCWTSPTTPPANPGNWPVVAAVTVPGSWVSDYYGDNYDSQGVEGCPASHDSTYGPGTISRQVSSSYQIGSSFTANLSVAGSAGSFVGSAYQHVSNSSGKRLLQSWTNSTTGNKHLCGVSTHDILGTGFVGKIVAKA